MLEHPFPTGSQKSSREVKSREVKSRIRAALALDNHISGWFLLEQR